VDVGLPYTPTLPDRAATSRSIDRIPRLSDNQFRSGRIDQVKSKHIVKRHKGEAEAREKESMA